MKYIAQEKQKNRRVFNVLGHILLIISIIYIARLLCLNFDNIFGIVSVSQVFKYLVPSVALYVLSFLILSIIWFKLIKIFTTEPLNLTACITSLSKSQIAKYLPGNVLHYVGRYIISTIYDIPPKSIAISIFLETLMLIISACILSIYLFWNYNNMQLFVFKDTKFFMLYFFIVFIILLVFLAYKRNLVSKFLGTIKEYFECIKQSYCVLIFAFLGYISFFCILGIILWYLNGIFIPLEAKYLMTFIAMSSLAWVIGYITPGAPGGVGIREAILIVGLSSSFPENEILLLTFVFRLVSILGDIILFLLGTALNRKL
ncbi:MAG: hypothetical protein KGZ94_11485 [Clostridia bacterium]|nr:hypothetical protein [Clostridia bacterium]